MSEENKEEKDPIDELLDEMPEDNGDEPEKKETAKKQEGEDGEDNKPVTLKDLKAMLAELKGSGSPDITEAINKFKEEINEKLAPVMKTAKQEEFKKSVVDFEKSVQENLPNFEVDVDLLEYHMTIGKSKKEALKLQVDKERARAEKYVKTQGSEEKKKPEDIDLSSFNPELHKDAKAFRKMNKEQKDKYWIQFNLFKRKQK